MGTADFTISSVAHPLKHERFLIRAKGGGRNKVVLEDD